MNTKKYLIITSIAGADNKALIDFSQQAALHNVKFIVIGDLKSPADFQLKNCDFYSIARQDEQDFSLVKQLPKNHYARKNIGYLLAMNAGAEQILESDDDNFPYPDFWNLANQCVDAQLFENADWLNVYKLFSGKESYPRGFSLEHIQKELPSATAFKSCKCPIQQGLANENPDVDAIYRLVGKLPVMFENSENVALGKGSWCPFNSQNTTWFRDAFLLMYLPSFCSFRMTDIWRSFVVQRICWENDWHVLFHSPTVWQERNMHNLMRDFSDEIVGYLHNHIIAENLSKLNLKSGMENIPENLLICYDLFVRMGLMDKMEMNLLNAWIKDCLSILK